MLIERQCEHSYVKRAYQRCRDRPPAFVGFSSGSLIVGHREPAKNGNKDALEASDSSERVAEIAERKALCSGCTRCSGSVYCCVTKSADTWLKLGMPKVVLQGSSAEEVVALAEQAKKAGLPVAVIHDADRTVVSPGAITCIGIGPAEEQEIDRFTGDMELVKSCHCPTSACTRPPKSLRVLGSLAVARRRVRRGVRPQDLNANEVQPMEPTR